MKYKVGQKVKIKSLDWYNENKDKDGNIVFSSKVPQFSWNVNVRTVFTKDMVKFCGKVVTIESVWTVNYSIVEGTYRYYFTDEMIEGLVEKETKPKFKVGDKVILNPYPCIVTDVHWRDSLHGFVYTVRGIDFSRIVKEGELIFDERLTPTTDEIIKNIKADWNNFKTRYNLPNDYHFVDKNGNEVNISEIVLEKKPSKTEDIIKWLRECDMTKYIGVIYSGMCSITFDTEKLIKDITEMIGGE